MTTGVRFGSTVAAMALLTAASSGGAQITTPPWKEDPFPSRYHAPTPDDMLLRGATILDGAGGRIDGGDVLVRGGKIAAVGKDLANPGVREVDAEGR